MMMLMSYHSHLFHVQALIWDIQQMPRAIEDPILAYTAAEGEINQIQWGATQPDWIGWHLNH